MRNVTALPDLANKLRALTGDPGPGYRACYLAALDGKFPTQKVKGRIFIADADLPKVAAVFGLAVTSGRAAA